MEQMLLASQIFWLFRTYCAKMLIKVSKKGLKEISYEKVNDKYTKFTGGHSRK